MRKFIYIALCCVLLQSSALSYEKYKRFPSGTPGRMKFPTSACSDGEILSFTSGAMVCASSAGGGDALVANPLSQFAATTSLQLIGVISDETGTGLSVFGTAPTFETSITGNYLTASEILITDASKNIVSAPEATYPSLAELAFVKGLTSGVQAQLNAKVTESTTVSAPLVKTTYALSIPKATTSADGYLAQADWDTFNNKAPTDSPTFTTAFTATGLIGDEDLQNEDFGEFTCAGEDACTIDDSVAVTGWNLTTPTITTSLTTDSKTISEAEIGRLDGLAGVITTDTTAVTEVDGRSLTIATATLNADEETYIYKAKIAFEDPVATDDFFFGELTHAVTFTSIYCKTLVGTVTLDVTSGGTDIEGTDIVCDTDGQSDAGISNASGSVSDEIKLAITSVASAPTYLFLQLNGTYDD